jgi:hypothetical protein
MISWLPLVRDAALVEVDRDDAAAARIPEGAEPASAPWRRARASRKAANRERAKG